MCHNFDRVELVVGMLVGMLVVSLDMISIARDQFMYSDVHKI